MNVLEEEKARMIKKLNEDIISIKKAGSGEQRKKINVSSLAGYSIKG